MYLDIMLEFGVGLKEF